MATTAGFLERPRLDDALFTVSARNEREVDIVVELTGRSGRRHLTAVVPVVPDKRGLYTWKSRGLLLPVLRTKWELACAPNRSVAALHHPATMVTQSGSAILLRADLDPATARRRVEAAVSAVNLSRSAFLDLSWRV